MSVFYWVLLNFSIGIISYFVVKYLYGEDYFDERFNLYGKHTMEWMFNFPILWFPYLFNRHILESKKIEDNYQEVSKKFYEDFREKVAQNKDDLEYYHPDKLNNKN